MSLGKLLERLQNLPNNVIRFYRGSQTESRTFNDLRSDVLRAADELTQAGVTSRARVGIFADNCYEWVVYDLALIHLDAVCVALPTEIFRDSPMPSLAANYGLTHILAPDSKTHVGSWPIQAIPPSAPSPVPADADLFTIVFSSGTSGRIKALEISRRGTEDLLLSFGNGYDFQSDDSILAFLPLSGFQQRWMVYAAIHYGFDVLVCRPERVFHALRDFKPTIVASPPLLYEAVESKYRSLPRLKRSLFDAARAALKPLPASVRKRLAPLMFRPFHSAFGGRTRFLLTGAAPSKLSTLDFFESIGMPLYQAYGMTETGFLTWNVPKANRRGSVGRMVFEKSLSIADDGEILFQRDPLLCRSYLGLPAEEAAATFVGPNKLATGDLGRFDADGFLYIVGRKKDIIVTQGGYKICPQDYEREIEGNVSVSRAVVLGGGALPALSVVVSLPVGSPMDAQRSVHATIERLNRDKSPPARIRNVVFTDQEFTTKNQLLNRSCKVDRSKVLDTFRTQLLAAE